MRRITGLALLSLTLFLAVFPLTVGKPGLPMTFKADEPAYYLMALSLARDLDLRCEPQDLGRLFDEYPFLAAFNLILMSDDGWRTVYFGKPYVYSLFAAPLAAWFGANGLVALNMMLLLAMVWMGTAYLGRYNPRPLAALYAAGFFFLSTGFAYVFWLHPEVFNMACVSGSLFFALHRFEESPGVGRVAAWHRRLFGLGMRPVWSGGLLALACYNKPMLGAVALPILFSFWRQGRLRALVAWAGSGLVTLAVLAGVAISLTGHPSAYLGVERMGVPVFDPQQMPVRETPRPPGAEPLTTNSWSWLLRVPDIDLAELTTHAGYFLWGRHTGMLTYLPFAGLSLLLFALHGRRSVVRWLTLLSVMGVAVFFLVWIPFNWHGGGGFIGNRYFVNVYPAMLYLVARIAPSWLTAGGYALGGLLLGPILFTPMGAPVPEPTLQAHVRNPPIRWFPLELDFRDKLPGYHGSSIGGAWFFGRKDVVRFKNEELLVHGATTVELWMLTAEPVPGGVVFAMRNSAPGNRIEIDLAGDRRQLEFSPDPLAASETRQVELRPRREPKRLKQGKRWVYAYRLLVNSSTGTLPNASRNAQRKHPVNEFYVGAALSLLGTREDLDRDLYHVQWGSCEIPRQVPSGQAFGIVARLTNRSGETWPATGPARVNLSYHWFDAHDRLVAWEGRRTHLPADLAPGRPLEVEQTVLAPIETGRYRLELDLVREQVSWFSRWRAGTTVERLIDVMPIDAIEDSPEPRAGASSPDPYQADQ